MSRRRRQTEWMQGEALGPVTQRMRAPTTAEAARELLEALDTNILRLQGSLHALEPSTSTRSRRTWIVPGQQSQILMWLRFSPASGMVNYAPLRPDQYGWLRMEVTFVHGTGNGMAKSLLHAASETYSVSNAVFAITRGHKESLDVCTILQGETIL
ncbi:hypothetical protein BS78_02G008200 [Paspalum vaginatum]|nr:hypothetical protein BS78_02G008200 [Paspalum vaginatum]KAJ1287411.1 hypothetical protein BS78_02G008200 [Paspalum vaginatum]KAJ1287412.1 hypothetical protein BS78_02G008200 [Paspalum vaginatum]KAJ1287413.1 hypothetical protein BS78_02G008200 [Paspalum vaginatum]